MLTPRSRRLILAALALVGALGALLFHRQSGGGMGGAISIPKLAWLSYTTFVWFLLCPILAFDPAVARAHRVVLGLFAAFMWARGALEIPMLFVWKNWRPPIGMAHDLAAAALLGWGLWVARRSAPAETRPLDRWMVAFIAVQIASVLVECLYAGLFERAVHGATTGPGAVWFAADGDPRFVAINRLTALLDVPLILFLAVFLVVCLRGPGLSTGAAR